MQEKERPGDEEGDRSDAAAMISEPPADCRNERDDRIGFERRALMAQARDEQRRGHDKQGERPNGKNNRSLLELRVNYRATRLTMAYGEDEKRPPKKRAGFTPTRSIFI